RIQPWPPTRALPDQRSRGSAHVVKIYAIRCVERRFLTGYPGPHPRKQRGHALGIWSHHKNRFKTPNQEEVRLQEGLERCKADPSTYASAAERLLMAIGEPELIDTSLDPRLSRIFSNKVIKRYPAFADFHGMEDAVERIVSFFKHAAQGLEERKQILYLLGPVGGGKSSIAERLKALMQQVPFYAIKDSPVFE